MTREESIKAMGQVNLSEADKRSLIGFTSLKDTLAKLTGEVLLFVSSEEVEFNDKKYTKMHFETENIENSVKVSIVPAFDGRNLTIGEESLRDMMTNDVDAITQLGAFKVGAVEPTGTWSPKRSVAAKLAGFLETPTAEMDSEKWDAINVLYAESDENKQPAVADPTGRYEIAKLNIEPVS